MGMIENLFTLAALYEAWDSVQANRGAPGVDQISISRWARHWEENLERLRNQIVSKTYRPTKPRRIQIYTSNGKIREISILTVTDRVAQRTFLNIIEPHFEQRFLGCSHAYRKGRSTSTAVQQVISYRDQGFQHVLDADIKACFDNIDHAILLEKFKRVIKDSEAVDLVNLWLQSGRKYRNQAKGLPQGAVISPLLCNIYLHALDAKVLCGRWKFIRYADDFIAMTQSPEQAQSIQSLVGDWLGELNLVYNDSKTSITSFDEGFTFLGVYFLRDRISYISHYKSIELSGKKLRNLYKFPPSFY